MHSRRAPIVIAGGGIAGVIAALRLAEHFEKNKIDQEIILIERGNDLLPESSSSYNNLRRAGIGFHYPDPETAEKCRRTITEVFAQYPQFIKGKRGRYLALRKEDSLFPLGKISDVHETLRNNYKESTEKNMNNAVLGSARTFDEHKKLVNEDPKKAANVSVTDFSVELPVDQYASAINTKRVVAAFETPERTLDWDGLKKHLVEEIKKHPNINVRTNTKVSGFSIGEHSRFKVSVKPANKPEEKEETIPTDFVFNATWQEIENLNKTLGFYIQPGHERTNRPKVFAKISYDPKEVKNGEELLSHPMLFCVGAHAAFTPIEKYDLAIARGSELAPNTIELKVDLERGYVYRVLDLNGNPAKGIIPWSALPSDAPKIEGDILSQKDKLLPEILKVTSAANHTNYEAFVTYEPVTNLRRYENEDDKKEILELSEKLSILSKKYLTTSDPKDKELLDQELKRFSELLSRGEEQQSTDYVLSDFANRVLAGKATPEEKEFYGKLIINGVSLYIPSLKNAKLLDVRFGNVRVAGCNVNINDPNSPHHKRTSDDIETMQVGFMNVTAMKFGNFLEIGEQIVERYKHHDLATKKIRSAVETSETVMEAPVLSSIATRALERSILPEKLFEKPVKEKQKTSEDVSTSSEKDRRLSSAESLNMTKALVHAIDLKAQVSEELTNLITNAGKQNPIPTKLQPSKKPPKGGRIYYTDARARIPFELTNLKEKNPDATYKRVLKELREINEKPDSTYKKILKGLTAYNQELIARDEELSRKIIADNERYLGRKKPEILPKNAETKEATSVQPVPDVMTPPAVVAPQQETSPSLKKPLLPIPGGQYEKPAPQHKSSQERRRSQERRSSQGSGNNKMMNKASPPLLPTPAPSSPHTRSYSALPPRPAYSNYAPPAPRSWQEVRPYPPETGQYWSMWEESPQNNRTYNNSRNYTNSTHPTPQPIPVGGRRSY